MLPRLERRDGMEAGLVGASGYQAVKFPLTAAITGQVASLDVFYFADDLVSLFSLPSSRQPRTVNQSTKKCLGTASATNGVRQSTR